MKELQRGIVNETGVKLIRKARRGFSAKFCTGSSHFLLQGNGQWSMCDSYLKIDHTQCQEEPTEFKGFIADHKV